ncbi:MAG: radical SAM protein [Acetatifactor sp.]|nr:radical SAM protein [Acetatifactor sp.]
MNIFTPIESHIILGYNCNHHCRHCVVQAKRSESENVDKNLSIEGARNAIDIAISNGASKIVLSGGEPTVRSDLPELVSYCLSQGKDVQIQTNGFNISMIKQVCEQNFSEIDRLEFMIPLHSADTDQNDFICGCTGGLKNAVASLAYLESIHANVIGKVVLTRLTGDLKELCRIYERYKACRVIIAYPHCVSFSIERVREIDLNESETREIFQGFYKQPPGIPVLLQGFPRCFIGDISGVVIQEEQKDYISLEIVEYKFQSRKGNSWHEYRKLDKRKFARCDVCCYNGNCEGIWKEYMQIFA